MQMLGLIGFISLLPLLTKDFIRFSQVKQSTGRDTDCQRTLRVFTHAILFHHEFDN